jgi:hypothetical protein
MVIKMKIIKSENKFFIDISNWQEKIKKFIDKKNASKLQRTRGKWQYNFTDYSKSYLYERMQGLYSGMALKKYGGEEYNMSESLAWTGRSKAFDVANDTLKLGKEFYARGFDVNEILVEKIAKLPSVYPIPASGYIYISPRVDDFRCLDEILKNDVLSEYNILIESMGSISTQTGYGMLNDRKYYQKDIRGPDTIAKKLKAHDYAFAGYDDIAGLTLDALKGESSIIIDVRSATGYQKYKGKIYGTTHPFIDIKDIFEKELNKK